MRAVTYDGNDNYGVTIILPVTVTSPFMMVLVIMTIMMIDPLMMTIVIMAITVIDP